MQRSYPGYSRAARSNRAAVTRRALLGAAAVIGGAGLADALHRPGRHKEPPASDPTGRSLASGKTRTTSEGGEVIRTGTSSPPSTSPSAHQSAAPPPTTTPKTSTPPSSSGQVVHPGAHGRAHFIPNEAAKVEHVHLPPAKVRVRHRPVYSIDELIHDAPKHAIALTVDDGPDPDWTPKVLRLLDKHRMQASFCVVGIHADAYPKLVRDVSRAGHVIVNHSYTHVQPFNRQTEKRIVAEITRTQRAIEKATKVTPQLFRAPGGAWSKFIFRAVAAYGLTPLDWDVDPRDWAMPGTRRIEHAMLKGRPGDIVLCHDGGGNRSETVRALRKVLPTWKHRGYTTIPLVVPASVGLTSQSPESPISPTPPSSPTASPSGSPSTSSSS